MDRAGRLETRDDPGADTGRSAYGIGLLTRLPVTAQRAVALPGGGDGVRPARPRNPGRPPSPGWDREPRAALVATLDLRARDWAPAAGEGMFTVVVTHLSYLPWRGVRQLRMALRAAPGVEPAVLLGDLNLPAWAVRAAAPRGWRHAGGGPTYPAWRPRVQLDHLLVRGALRLRAVRRAAPGPSDHLALVADLDL